MANDRQELERLRKIKRLRELEAKQGVDNGNVPDNNLAVPSVNRVPDRQSQPVEDKSFLDSVGEFFTGSERQTRATKELPEIGQGGLLFGEDATKTKAVIPALLTTTDPVEMGNILKNNFSNIGITQDEKGNLIANNNKTDVKVVLNQPGISQLDIMQGLGIASAFTPAGRLSGFTKVVAGSGATSAGIEALQALSGGEFNPEQVVIDATTAGLLDKAFQVAKATGRSIRDVLKKDAKIDPDRLLKSFEKKNFTSQRFGRNKAESNIPKSLQKASQPDLTTEALAKIRQAEGQGIQLTKAQATGDFGASDAEQTLLKSTSPEGEQARQFAKKQQEQLKPV